MTTIHIRVVWTKWCEEEVVLRYYSKKINAFVSFKVLSCDYIKRLLNDVERSWPQSHTIVCCVAWQKKEYSQKDHFHVICSDGMAAHQQYSLAVQQLPFAFDSGRRTEVKKSQFCLNCLTKRLTVRLTNVYPIPHGALQHTICRAEMVDMFCRRVSIMHQHRSSLINLIVTQKKKSHFFLRLAFWLCICTGANGMSPARRLAFNRIFLGVEVEKTNKKYPRRRKKVM